MKKSFLTGLMILLPIAITFFLLSFILDIFTSPFLDMVSDHLGKYKHLLPFLDSPAIVTFLAKIIIIIFFIIGIFLLGALGRWIIFKTLLNWGNFVLLKIPFIKSIYHTSKDLINSIVSLDERKAFVHPVMVDFPSKYSQCVGFLSGSVPPECQKALNKELTAVFIPTAPHPISGYMIFVPKDLVININMTNEEAIKFTVSCGVITPESKVEKDDDKSHL